MAASALGTSCHSGSFRFIVPKQSGRQEAAAPRDSAEYVVRVADLQTF